MLCVSQRLDIFPRSEGTDFPSLLTSIMHTSVIYALNNKYVSHTVNDLRGNAAVKRIICFTS